MKIDKSLIRGTHEREYTTFDTYHYMLDQSNIRSKMALEVDENGRFKNFFVPYVSN